MPTTVQVVFDPIIMLSNAAAAFGLNMSVFLLIGKVSLLVLPIAGRHCTNPAMGLPLVMVVVGVLAQQRSCCSCYSVTVWAQSRDST